MRSLPRLDPAYWASLSAASIVGANWGDWLAESLGLGHLQGLPFLAVLLAAVLLAEARVGLVRAGGYWLAILLVRAAATNVGDVFHDWQVGFGQSIPLVAVLLFVWLAVGRRLQATALATGALPVSPTYWVGMFLAGVLGTLLGDYASFGLRLFPPVAAAVLGGLFLLALVLGWRGRSLAWFWSAVVLVRAAGTAAGDWGGQALGMGACTALTTGVFLAMVAYLYRPGGPHLATRPTSG